MTTYNMELSNILYHWWWSMDSFRLCETYLLHIQLFEGNQSAIFAFLGRTYRIDLLKILTHLLYLKDPTYVLKDQICQKRPRDILPI